MQSMLTLMAVFVLKICMMIALEVTKIECLVIRHVSDVSMAQKLVASSAMTFMHHRLAEFENVMMDMWTMMKEKRWNEHHAQQNVPFVLELQRPNEPRAMLDI